MKKNNMIKILPVVLLSAILFSCNDRLDINENPNSPTGSVVTPNLQITAIYARLATDIHNYNCYGSLMVGYQFPGDGVSGFGDLYSYNFPSSSYTGRWNDNFAHLRDIQGVINAAAEDPYYQYFGAAAHLAKVITYQLLVDEYGDVPYTEGVRGGENITPKFDDDAEVYKYLISEIDEAISLFKSGNETTLKFTTSTDGLFGGDLTKWIQFANNLKLRLLIRAAGSEIDSFVQSNFTFSPEGFLLETAGYNPGYNASNQQNPVYNDYHSSVSGSISGYAHYYLPTTYLMTFYQKKFICGDEAVDAIEEVEGKLTDDRRGSLTYLGYPDVPNYMLGFQGPERPYTPNYIWIEGILKGRTQDFGMFYDFETYFLLAEAALIGHELNGDWKTNFKKGMIASFHYLATNVGGNLVDGADPEADVEEYIKNNSDSYLVNADKATTKEQQLEAIITQAYIAYNIINGHEAWNNYRRTAYPTIDNTGRRPNLTFASYLSDSPRPDRLSVRLVYPQDEYDLNYNTPDVGDSYSNPIFWDRN